MSPSVSKDAILDAAEAVVCESGAAHMTLDGVAERAGISKGGLMYSFPSKAALLQGMVGRLIEKIEALREQVRAEYGDAKPNEALIEIRLLSKMDEMGSGPASALLATIANQPDLMEPFRDEMRRRFADRVLSGKDARRSTVLFLAALGLYFASLLNIPFLDSTRRKMAYDDLLRLAASEKEKL